MRQPNRTPKRRNLLPILYSSRIPPSTSSPSPSTPKHRNALNTYPPILTATDSCLLRRQDLMSRLSNRFPSKNTPLWSPPLTSKGPRRSSSSRINSPSGNPTKTWRLWHNTYNSNSRPLVQRHNLPNCGPGPLRSHYNWLYLPPTNRPKIINCLLIC